MPSFFSRLTGKDGSTKSKRGGPQPATQQIPVKPQWEDAWTRKSVEPEEIQELMRGCTLELKSRALDMPFLLLPFRPTSDPSAARSFIRNFFDRSPQLHTGQLAQELRLTEPMVLCSVAKWCWSRLPGGVVGWESYELFRTGEQDSNMARDSFATFVPLSVDSDARKNIIFDFFDLLSAIAAHSKTNGLGGRKLSRLAGWWAFEHADTGNGFDGGYKGWAAAADATSHLFFAYLRSLSPEFPRSLSGISTLPRSLQALVQGTEYPPEPPSLMNLRTTKVVMIVDVVSPTPFALLRRANHFQYRDDDDALQEFAKYEDPVKALTDECRRVLRSIYSANQSQVSSSKQSTSLPDASWSRFEDIGFSAGFDEADEADEDSSEERTAVPRRKKPQGLRTTPKSQNMDIGRPTTPSWADFLSAGFVDEAQNTPAPLLLPPDKQLPPIDRGRSSQSHRLRLESERDLDPGELASIVTIEIDDAFWWVWISSLAGEEPAERKAVFGRCALVETIIKGGKWLVIEEIVKGAAPEPISGAYVAEKKSRFGWSKRGKDKSRRMSMGKDSNKNGLQPPYKTSQPSRTSIGPDQHARIQAAAAQLSRRQKEQEEQEFQNTRRGRNDMEAMSQKTSSVFTLQPVIMNEASPAMKWASKYDKDAIREAYLANSNTGRGVGQDTLKVNGNGEIPSPLQRNPSSEHALPALPTSANDSQQDLRPAVPAKTSTPPPASLAPTPTADYNERHEVSEKVAEIPLPRDSHPVARKPVKAASPLLRAVSPTLEKIRTTDYRGQSTDRSFSTVQSTGNSPESKEKHKLQKKPTNPGFRNMFGRSKDRDSNLPPPLSQNNLKGQGQLQSGGATLGRRFSGFRKKSPVSSPTEQQAPSSAMGTASIAEDDLTPVQTSEPVKSHSRSFVSSLHESLSRVNTSEAHEASQAFSSFDQGPLDVPAFVPDTTDSSPRVSEDAAMPPSVPRKHISALEPPPPTIDAPELTRQVSPVQDRWAQIRKNAAERAAQRQSEEQSRGGHSAATDNDGETSGEETIESRVARIKARVAELTGNMETGGPAAGLRS